MAGGDAQVLELAGREVRITSPGKVLFGERGETKLDLVRYYAARRRAAACARWAAGRCSCSASRRAPAARRSSRSACRDSAPEWLQTTTVQTVNGTPSRALVAADVAHVAWAVNLACLGFHVWPHRADDPEHADELRLDLDPQPGTGFAEARAAARELKALLDELGIAGFPEDDRQPRPARLRPAGSRAGTPTRCAPPRWPRRASSSAAAPTSSPPPGGRRSAAQRIFVDYNQNAPHKTVFGAWSVRARAGRAGLDAARAGRSSTTSTPTS